MNICNTQSCKDCDWILNCKIAKDKNLNERDSESFSVHELIVKLLNIPNQNKTVTLDMTVGDIFNETLADEPKDNSAKVPLEIGQSVWLPFIYGDSAREGTVTALVQNLDKTWEFEVTQGTSVEKFTLTDVGDRVFLSKTSARNKVNRLKEELKI